MRYIDSAIADEIIEILLNINEKGKTLIVVTHDIKVANETWYTVRIMDSLIVSDLAVARLEIKERAIAKSHDLLKFD